jgi:predicted alpha/beta hydrolase family esterase
VEGAGRRSARASQAQSTVPPIIHYFGEAVLPINWVQGRLRASALAAKWPGDGRTIVVIPGLGSTDRHTALLRKTLNIAGYKAFGWGLGYGGPIKADLFDRIDRRLNAIASEGPVTLIGWSLGGVIARDYANYAPSRVAEIITLGSPFSGNPRHNRAWRIYEFLADHPVDQPPVGGNYQTKPAMRTTAIWSDRDGIIPQRASQGQADQSDATVRISCGHFSMSCAPQAIEAVLQTLANR